MRYQWIFVFASQIVFAQNVPVVHSKASWRMDPPLLTAELELRTPEVPRADLGPKIMSDKVVKECLRQSLLNAGDDFKIHLTGRVDAAGVIHETHAETYNPAPLAQCIQDAVDAVNLTGKGQAGEFRITIERHRITNREAQLYPLDLSEPTNSRTDPRKP